jgi:hypothetical protein
VTISANQIRSARAALRWTSPTIAKRSKVAFATVLKAQLDADIHAVSAMDLRAIRTAFETAGVNFMADGGVQMRKVNRRAIGAGETDGA